MHLHQVPHHASAEKTVRASSIFFYLAPTIQSGNGKKNDCSSNLYANQSLLCSMAAKLLNKVGMMPSPLAVHDVMSENDALSHLISAHALSSIYRVVIISGWLAQHCSQFCSQLNVRTKCRNCGALQPKLLPHNFQKNCQSFRGLPRRSQPA
jgi:hypothetical protein